MSAGPNDKAIVYCKQVVDWYCNKTRRPPLDREELVAHCWLQLCLLWERRKGMFDSEDHMEKEIYVRTHGAIKDYYNHKYVESRGEQFRHMEYDAEMDLELAHYDNYDIEDNRKYLVKWLRSVPNHRTRHWITLRLQGWGLREIGERYGVSEGLVSKRINEEINEHERCLQILQVRDSVSAVYLQWRGRLAACSSIEID